MSAPSAATRRACAWSGCATATRSAPQRAWIEADLAAAAAARARGDVSFLIVQPHYPSYCSHSYDGGGGCVAREVYPLPRAAGDQPRA